MRNNGDVCYTFDGKRDPMALKYLSMIQVNSIYKNNSDLFTLERGYFFFYLILIVSFDLVFKEK